jgi:hypothetical protein
VVTPGTDAAGTISRLEARVESLERLLAERSRLLRQLALVLCDDDLLSLSRLAVGQPPTPRAGFGLRGSHETTELTYSDVDKTMAELWRAAASPALDER